MRSGVPSRVRSPSTAGGLSLVPSNHTVVAEPIFPPGERALTVRVLTSRVSGTVMPVDPVADTVTGGAWLTW